MDDVYGDLENYEEFSNIEQIKEENKYQKDQIENLTTALAKLTQDHDKLLNDHKALELNYSSLLKTARAEIERKTLLIRNLNTEKDQLVLKCLGKGKKSYLSQAVNQTQTKKSTSKVKHNCDDKKVKIPVDSSISSSDAAEKPTGIDSPCGESLQATSICQNPPEKLNFKIENGPDNIDNNQQDIKKDFGKLLSNEETTANIYESNTNVLLKTDNTHSDFGELSLTQSNAKNHCEKLNEIKAAELCDSLRERTPQDHNDDSRKKIGIVNEISNRDPRLKIKSELRGTSVESNSNAETDRNKERESKVSRNSSPIAQSDHKHKSHIKQISKEATKKIKDKDAVIKEQYKLEPTQIAQSNETSNTNENLQMQPSNLREHKINFETKKIHIDRTLGKSPLHTDILSDSINKNIINIHPKKDFLQCSQNANETKFQNGNDQCPPSNELKSKHKLECNARKSRRDDYFEDRLKNKDEYITSTKYRSKSSYREKNQYYDETGYTETYRYHEKPLHHNNFKYRSKSRQQYKSKHRDKSRYRDDSRHRDSSDYRENSDHREGSGNREILGHRETTAYREKLGFHEDAYRGKRKSRENSWDRSRARYQSRSRKYDNENNDSGESRPNSRHSYNVNNADMKIYGDRRKKATDYFNQKLCQYQSDGDSDKGSHSSGHKKVRSRGRSRTRSEKKSRSKSSSKHADSLPNNLKIENTANSNTKSDYPGKLRQRRKSMFESRTSEFKPVLASSDEETDVFNGLRDRNRSRNVKRSSKSDAKKGDCQNEEKHNIVSDLRNVLVAKSINKKSPPSEPAHGTVKQINDAVNATESDVVNNNTESHNDTKGKVTPPKQILKSSLDTASDFDDASFSAKHKLCDSSICSTEKRQKLHFEQFEIDNEIIGFEQSVENKNLFSRDDYRRLDNLPFQSPEDTEQRRECVEVPLIKSCMDFGIRQEDPRLSSSKYVFTKVGDKIVSLCTKKGADVDLVRIKYVDTINKTVDNPEINQNATDALQVSKPVASQSLTVEKKKQLKINEQNLPCIDSNEYLAMPKKVIPEPPSECYNVCSETMDKSSNMSPKKHIETTHIKGDPSQLPNNADTQLPPKHASSECQSRKVEVEIHCQRVSESDNYTKPDDNVNAAALKNENPKKLELSESEANQKNVQVDAKEIEFIFLEQKLSALISSPFKGTRDSSLRISNVSTPKESNEIAISGSKADSSLENLVKCLESDDAHPSEILTEDVLNLRSLHSTEIIENTTSACEFPQIASLLRNNSCPNSEFLGYTPIKDSSYVPSKPMTTAELLKDFVMSDDACDSAEFCSITGKTSSNANQQETVTQISDHVTKGTGTESEPTKHAHSRKRKISISSCIQTDHTHDSDTKPKKKRVQLITLRTNKCDDKVNTRSHKTKFSELFGDSTSSLITPDDLNISCDKVRTDMPDLLVDSRVDFSKAKIASSIDDIIPEKDIVTDNSLTVETKQYFTGLEKISPLPNSSKSGSSLNLSSPTIIKKGRGRPRKNSESTKVSQTGTRGRKPKGKESGTCGITETENINKSTDVTENTNELIETENMFGTKIDITPGIFNSREETRSDTLINAELFKYNQEYSMLTSTPNKRLYEITKARMLPNAVITNYNVMAADPNVFTIQSGIAPNLSDSSNDANSKPLNTQVSKILDIPVAKKHAESGSSELKPTKNVAQNSFDTHGKVNNLENRLVSDEKCNNVLKDSNGSVSECSTTTVSPPTLSIRISRRRNIIRK